jgi:hypothetical protein
MSSTDRQNNLLVSEDWQKIYQSFKNADFQSYDFDNLRRTMIEYIRINFPEDFNDYIESSEYLALIDLIAYIGQSIAFRVDLNARENFLELASRRDSVLRLARMIGYNPKRNNAASGLLKFNAISTTENVIDSNGRNLSGQYVTWNDASNSNWYNQFITVINAALPQTQQFGNPIDSATIYGVPTAQYRFNATNTNVPIYGFTKTIAGRSMNFEITSTTFKGQTYIYEEAPKTGNSIACVYSDDGYGASSPGTGFFFNFTQGTLNTATFTVSTPTGNQQIDIGTPGINNSDVWLYALSQTTGLESTLWTKVSSTVGSNIIYNSLTGIDNNIYSVVTRTSDAVSLQFADGTFGNLPQGKFLVYYRVSNGLTYTINPSDIVNILFNIPYTSSSNQVETLTISLSLSSSVTNSAASESNTSIKTNAPQTYYTQNRMITGEDYNISPLSASLEVLKVKSINRTSSGISRYFDLTDPTGKYSSTNLFADDGILYQEIYTDSTNFTFVTALDIEGVINNTVYNILQLPDLRNFFYANFLHYLSISLNVAWVSVTTDTNSVSGYVTIPAQSVPYKVGSYTATDLKYLTSGALLKFVAPSGYYFNTINNQLVAGTATVPNSTSYLWAQVISVTGDGTATGTGVLSTGFGPIILNKVVPSSAILTQVIPQFNTTISASVQTTMIDLITANSNFGLRYDATSQSWQIIFANNLNLTGAFSLANQGDATNLQLDSSWMLAFTSNTVQYTISTRKLHYVFQSASEVAFYFDSNTKVYDNTASTTVLDTVKVLSVNTQPDQTIPFTQDLTWQITSAYVGTDGYVDPTKIVVNFADSTGSGIVDNPQLFLDIVNPSVNPLTKYIVQQQYTISSGQLDYQFVANNPLVGPVVILPTQPSVYSNYTNGTYFYFVDVASVFQLNTAALNPFVPTLAYQVFSGRGGLKFQYIHNADYDSRIDPGSSNIIDVYILTLDYDTAFRQWIVSGGTGPLPPSSDQLNSLLSSNLNLIKSISDEIVYHPVSYKLLFGSQADSNLQANFNVMINPNSSVSNADVQARILTAINTFFSLDNWNFGDTFYFSELSTYVVNQLTPDVINFAIVPIQPNLFFGNLFQIDCPSNQILISCATASNIVVVDAFTSSNLKTVTSPPTTSLISTQTVTSAALGSNQ